MAAETPQTQPQQEPKQEEKPGTRELKPEEEPKKTSLVKPAANQSDLEIEILKVLTAAYPMLISTLFL